MREFRHAACGGALDTAGRCAACAVTPPAEDVLMAPLPGFRNGRSDPVALALCEPHRLLEPIGAGQPGGVGA